MATTPLVIELGDQKVTVFDSGNFDYHVCISAELGSNQPPVSIHMCVEEAKRLADALLYVVTFAAKG